jgi:hypothetical protein
MLELAVYNITRVTIIGLLYVAFTVQSIKEGPDKKDTAVVCACSHFKKGSSKESTQKRGLFLVLLSCTPRS